MKRVHFAALETFRKYFENLNETRYHVFSNGNRMEALSEQNLALNKLNYFKNMKIKTNLCSKTFSCCNVVLRKTVSRWLIEAEEIGRVRQMKGRSSGIFRQE